MWTYDTSAGCQSAPEYGLLETNPPQPLYQRKTSWHGLQGRDKKVRCNRIMVSHDVEITTETKQKWVFGFKCLLRWRLSQYLQQNIRTFLQPHKPAHPRFRQRAGSARGLTQNKIFGCWRVTLRGDAIRVK